MRVLLDKERFEKYFQIALLLVAITLPFSSRAINSMAIILTIICWCLMSSFQDKKRLLLGKIQYFIFASLPFIINLISALVHFQDFKILIEDLQKAIPLIVFPLIYATIQRTLIQREQLLKVFSYATLASALLAIIIAWYLKINMYGDYLFYDQFAIIINKHTTYFSLFVVVSILVLSNNVIESKKGKLWQIISIFILLYTLYLLSTRIAIVALTLGMLCLFFIKLKGEFKWIIGVVTLILVMSMLQLPNFIKRFDPNPYPSENKMIDDYTYRELHWKAVFNSINESPLIGLGNSNQRNSLYQKYENYGLVAAYDEMYNAHNQVLEFGLKLGYLGIIIFLIFCIYMLRYLILKEKEMGLLLFLIFLVFCFTESMLVRQSGIVFFAVIIASYFYPPKEIEI